MADLTYTGWSSVKSLDVYYNSGTRLSSDAYNWKDTLRIGVGANYKLDPNTKLRFGLAFDPTPTNDVNRTPRLPAFALLYGFAFFIPVLGVVAMGTHWFARLPLAVLAASIVVAAISMIDVRALKQAWSYDRADALALLGTALGVLVLGLEQGIALGIGLSLATLLLRASTPHIAVIGRIAGTEHFRNVQRHGVETIPGVLFLRIDESLFFGNLGAFEARLAAELEQAPATHDVVLIMSAVNRVDTTAMEVLTDVNRELAQRHIHLHLAEVKGPVQDRLERTLLWKSLSGSVHLSVNAAFESLAALHT